ncbi:MAG: hypothetical protein D6675_14680, partial [Gemmatimonadetes bacterium]
GQTVTLTGVADCFSGAPQYLPAYPDHISSAGGGSPVISNIVYNPADPEAGETVTVSATVSDDGSITTVDLIYNAGSGDVTTAMTPIGGDVYEGEIPGFADGTSVSFWVQATDNDGNTTTSAPQIYIVGQSDGLYSIQFIQENRDALLNQTVTVEATVTMGFGSLRSDRTSIYIQDDSGYGLNLYNAAALTDLVRGTRLRVTGTITEFNGVLEIEPQNPAQDIEILATGLPVEDLVEEVSIAQAKSARWDGALIRVKGTVIEVGTNIGGGSNILVRDFSGSIVVRIWDSAVEAGLFGENTGSPAEVIERIFQKDDFYQITGIGSVYNGEYQILTGYGEDVVNLTESLGDNIIFNVETLMPGQIPGNGLKDEPFAPDLGEMLHLTINCPTESRFTLMVYDLDGREVRNLTPGGNAAGGYYEISWNGTDDNRERLNIGIYLLYFEIRDSHGKVQTEIKPVVLGTPTD